MAVMAFTLFEQLFDKIDTVTHNYVTSVSSQAIADAIPIVWAGLIVSFYLYCLAIMFGMVQQPLIEFIYRCIKITIIVAFVSIGGLYQSDVADAIQNVPNELAVSLLPGQGDQVQGTTAAQLIDQTADAGFAQAGKAFENSGLFSEQGIAFAVYAFLVTLGTAFMTAIGGALILMAKVMLAILAGLGPFFILALLFESTAGFFQRWAAQVVSFGLLIVILAAVFGFFMQIFTTYMELASFDNGTNFAATLGGAVILSVVSCLVLLMVPGLAAGLSGGITADLFGAAAQAMRIGAGAIGAAKGAGKMAGGGYRAAKSGLGMAKAGAVAAAGRFRGSAAKG